MIKNLLFVILLFAFSWTFGKNGSQFISQTVPTNLEPNQTFTASITFKNTGTTTWKKSRNYNLGSQSPQDNSLWGVGRVYLPRDVTPGEQVTFSKSFKAPGTADLYGYSFQWQMVQDGVEWFGEKSDNHMIFVGTGTLPDSLITSSHQFSTSNHIVATSMFHWYGKNSGQLVSPWIPIEGRDKWTGEVPFWKTMIKQAMAANIDVFYILVIPSMEKARLNLFRALNELRREGWDVPKVCPFFDPIITYTIKGVNGNAATKEGKDEIVGHYIRFYKQYYSQNTDEFADDFIYTLGGIPVLDTWHVHLHIDNYQQMIRQDIVSRLRAEFGAEHPIFNKSIRMITTAISPSFTFADEKIHQFEVQEYYIEKDYNNIKSVQLKPGYWDQNVRNPGYILKRDGGSKYVNAWTKVNSTINRVYIESFNEYDEGSGIYAARTDTVYTKTDGGMNNTNSDIWSAANDPYEYIKTTAAGAAKFNDNEKLNAKIIWHNIPDEMGVGETFNAKVIVRNEGNEQWNAANNFKFGQQDSDPAIFGSSRYLIDDSQNDIPDFGGIFRGRAMTFNLEIVAPETEGEFVTHWGMLQEDIAWFGEVIEKTIKVSETTDIRQQNVQKYFNIYPNPVSLNETIEIDGTFNKHDRIVLTGLNGNIVFEKVIQNNTNNLSLYLQKNSIVEGIYIIQIISNNSIHTKKIIVNNK